MHLEERKPEITRTHEILDKALEHCRKLGSLVLQNANDAADKYSESISELYDHCELEYIHAKPQKRIKVETCDNASHSTEQDSPAKRIKVETCDDASHSTEQDSPAHEAHDDGNTGYMNIQDHCQPLDETPDDPLLNGNPGYMNVDDHYPLLDETPDDPILNEPLWDFEIELDYDSIPTKLTDEILKDLLSDFDGAGGLYVEPSQ
jgi:hypothetical protein